MLFPYDYFVVPTATVVVLYLYYTRSASIRREEIPASRTAKVLAKKHKKEEEDDALSASKFPMKVFFGSQTGTAEDFAKKFAQEAKQWGFRPKVIDLENYNVDDLSEEDLCVFMLATYGEGEPTDNARDFWSWINDESKSQDHLSKLRYVIFGLGNKTYEHFNEVARVADKRFTAFGGKRIGELGEGDDDSSLEEDFLTWKELIWPEICHAVGIEATGGNVLTRQYKMTTYKIGDSNLKPDFKIGKEASTLKSAIETSILINRELHGKGSDRSCRHIEIDATRLPYDTGDHLGVYPSNETTLVEQYIQRLDCDKDLIFSLHPLDSSINKARFPSPCSLFTALSYYCDLTGYATKKMIRVMAEYANDTTEKDRLMLLAGTSAQSKEEYGKYVKEGMRTVLEVLNEFPSVKIPVDHFLEEMPQLQCRFYSISSSPLLHKTTIHITAVVADWTTPQGVQKKGVTTRWLAETIPQQKIKCFVRKSTFRLPRDVSLPVIMVGPGTGLAPFRGFIQDRYGRIAKGDKVGNTILYFGCRQREIDFIYEEEMLGYTQNKTLSELNLAFSRENPNKKVYVQHLIKNNADSVYKNFIESKGYFYVCGEGSKMAKDVQKVLIQIISEKQNITEEKAKELLATLQKQGKMQQDVWS